MLDGDSDPEKGRKTKGNTSMAGVYVWQKGRGNMRMVGAYPKWRQKPWKNF